MLAALGKTKHRAGSFFFLGHGLKNLGGSGGAANGGFADGIAAGEFVERSALRAAAAGLFLLLRVRVRAGGRPICCPRALARLLPSAVRVRIRSRSTSAKPPNTASIKRPVLVSAHSSATDRNCALASTMRLTMPNRSKVLRARRSPSPRRRGRRL